MKYRKYLFIVLFLFLGNFVYSQDSIILNRGFYIKSTFFYPFIFSNNTDKDFIKLDDYMSDYAQMRLGVEAWTKLPSMELFYSLAFDDGLVLRYFDVKYLLPEQNGIYKGFEFFTKGDFLETDKFLADMKSQYKNYYKFIVYDKIFSQKGGEQTDDMLYTFNFMGVYGKRMKKKNKNLDFEVGAGIALQRYKVTDIYLLNKNSNERIRLFYKHLFYPSPVVNAEINIKKQLFSFKGNNKISLIFRLGTYGYFNISKQSFYRYVWTPENYDNKTGLYNYFYIRPYFSILFGFEQ